ncbi:nuclear transport factor 2 family protein [Nocardia cyriacigeorgica]|uniref:nuclear transport factor 2 family protein n=1 Tax=Nocardia cyriacigeorgica TaxID=135487 RepID=UPI0013BC48D3|nr:nuclear transport factor 2 family protein [Nocardia cyriacigeorgica]NEW48974.1 nuclear transport factor 2 family protein [Nocardia cyriacigeorgica]
MSTTYDDEREIHRNIIRFARAMDNRAWNEITEIMTENATADLGTGHLASPTETIALMRSFLDDCGPTQHLIANVMIDIDIDTAHSSAYVADLHLGTGEREGQSFRTLGEYHDEWTRTADGWRMSHRTKRNNGHLGTFAVLGPGPAG